MSVESQNSIEQPRVVRPSMTAGLIVAGLGLAAVGFAGRYAIRYSRVVGETLKKQLDQLPQGVSSKYYRGGFEPRMNKREAGLILGVSPAASGKKVKEAHKRIMLLNHPDRGGSPYIAAKINEAKDYLDSHKP